MRIRQLNGFNETTNQIEEIYPVTHKDAIIGLNEVSEQTNASLQTIINWCNNISTVLEVGLSVSGWSSSYPHAQTVSNPAFKDDSMLALVKTLDGTEVESEVKAYNKAFDLIFAGTTSDGFATFYASKIPAIDFTVGLKGV